MGEPHGETGGDLELPVGPGNVDRYGSETVVPSPDAEMLKVPAALFGEYWYCCQPVGGLGIEAMNGPAVWPCHADRLLNVGLSDLGVGHAGRCLRVGVEITRPHTGCRLAGRDHDVRAVVAGPRWVECR